MNKSKSKYDKDRAPDREIAQVDRDQVFGHKKGQSASYGFLKPYSESGKKVGSVEPKIVIQKKIMVYTLVPESRGPDLRRFYDVCFTKIDI